MAHPDCGLFRLAEDYRDHLPCEKCEPTQRPWPSVVDLHADTTVRAAVAAANTDRDSDGTPSSRALTMIGETVMRALGIWQRKSAS